LPLKPLVGGQLIPGYREHPPLVWPVLTQEPQAQPDAVFPVPTLPQMTTQQGFRLFIDRRHLDPSGPWRKSSRSPLLNDVDKAHVVGLNHQRNQMTSALTGVHASELPALGRLLFSSRLFSTATLRHWALGLEKLFPSS
jgi:hypothetical protein